MKHLVSLLAVLFIFASASLAQIGLSSTILGPDTVLQGDNETITVYLSNDTTVTISGPVVVKLAVDSAGQIISTQTVNAQLQPGDTSAITIPVDFTMQNGFEPGGNIVLIWPEMPNFPTTDTLTHSIYILPTVAADLDSLGCDAGSVPVPPVLWQDFPLTYSIVNRGSEDVTHAFEVAVAVYDGPTLTEVQSLANQQVTNLAPGASDPGFTNFDINWVQQFGDGGNVIVVWPRMPDMSPDSFVTVDSLWIPVEVAPVGIDEPADAYLSNIKVFPNPATGIVYVRFLGGNEPIERVTVTDINGRVVEQHGYVAQLNFSDYPAGYYFVEVTVDSGQSRTFKLVRF